MTNPNSTFAHRLIRWRFLLVVNLFAIVFLGLSLGREAVRNRSISSQIAELQAQAEALTARNIEVSELKTAMQTEVFIEREARLKLGMKKPGETVVVIGEEAKGVQGTSDASDPLGYVIENQAAVPIANPTRWWYYFFDKDAFSDL